MTWTNDTGDREHVCAEHSSQVRWPLPSQIFGGEMSCFGSGRGVGASVAEAVLLGGDTAQGDGGETPQLIYLLHVTQSSRDKIGRAHV